MQYNITDTLPGSVQVELTVEFDKMVLAALFQEHAKTLQYVTELSIETIADGSVRTRITYTDGPTAKKVLKKVYQNNKFINIICIERTAPSIFIVLTDGIITIDDLILVTTNL